MVIFGASRGQNVHTPETDDFCLVELFHWEGCLFRRVIDICSWQGWGGAHDFGSKDFRRLTKLKSAQVTHIYISSQTQRLDSPLENPMKYDMQLYLYDVDMCDYELFRLWSKPSYSSPIVLGTDIKISFI